MTDDHHGRLQAIIDSERTSSGRHLQRRPSPDGHDAHLWGWDRPARCRYCRRPADFLVHYGPLSFSAERPGGSRAWCQHCLDAHPSWVLADCHLESWAYPGAVPEAVGIYPLPAPAIAEGAPRRDVRSTWQAELARRWPECDFEVAVPTTKAELDRLVGAGESPGKVRTVLAVTWTGGPPVGETVNALAALSADEPTSAADGPQLIGRSLAGYYTIICRRLTPRAYARAVLACLAAGEHPSPYWAGGHKIERLLAGSSWDGPVAEVPEALVDITAALIVPAGRTWAEGSDWARLISLELTALEALADIGPAWRGPAGHRWQHDTAGLRSALSGLGWDC